MLLNARKNDCEGNRNCMNLLITNYLPKIST